MFFQKINGWVRILGLGAAAAMACDHGPDAPVSTGTTAPLIDGLGRHHHKISTRRELAQKYFDQGLTLAYAFNHAEAERSFRQAAVIDPGCAICFWGSALVLGPNMNSAMYDASVPTANKDVARALELKAHASPLERDLIAALGKRYPSAPVKDRSSYDRAYREAMAKVALKYPKDLDVTTLYAESLMDEHPWTLWTKDGQAEPWTQEIMALLEKVLKKDPSHPGANHYYIHAVEASPHPERALASAHRLADLTPAAGHMVHMPSHIYLPLGLYSDCIRINSRAIAADDAYIEKYHPRGAYALTYRIHNHQFLFFASTLAGDSKDAFAAADKMREYASPVLEGHPDRGALEGNVSARLIGWVRFGKWNQILGAPEPESKFVYSTGLWRFARALAKVRGDDIKGAKAELAALKKALADPALKAMGFWGPAVGGDETFFKITSIATGVAEAEIALKERHFDAAIEKFKGALAIEDELNAKHHELPAWQLPVRQFLGVAYLEAGRPAEAEKTFRDELKSYRENGWSLYGLEQSLKAQGKDQEASDAHARFDAAWKSADVILSASRF